MLTRRWTRSALTAALLASLTTACDDAGTAPRIDPALDPEAAISDYRALDAILAGVRWDALTAVGSGAGALSAGAAAALQPIDALRAAADDAPLRMTRRLARALAETSPPAAAPLISPTHLGTTFVYDRDKGRYVADPARSDAPADGVRFDLYETAPDGTPLSGEVIGHADLVDEGSEAEGIRLALAVVVDGETILDYRTAVSPGPDEHRLAVDGFVAGAEGRLDFDIDILGRDEVVDLDFRLAVEARGFVIDGVVDGISDTSDGGGIDLRVRHGADEVALVARTGEGVIDGELRVGGERFATLEGPASDPTVLSADGDALTPREVVYVRAVVDVVDDVFDLVEGLVDPTEDLVLVAVLL